MDTSDKSKDTSQNSVFYNGRLYPGQKLLVPEPTPFGTESRLGATLIGWSRTECQGKLIDREECWVFHDDGKQPTMWLYGGAQGLLVIDRPTYRRVARQFRDVEVYPGPGEVITSYGWTNSDAFSSIEEARLRRYHPGPWEFSKENDPTDAPKKPAESSLEPAKPMLAHPILHSPWVPQNKLPHTKYTHTTPACADLGHYVSRPKEARPSHRMLTSSDFTIVIRQEGPFDSSGRQPGLIIPRTKHFTIRVLDKGFVPGERKVEIWRNGETMQLSGLIEVMADEHGWFLGDKALRKAGEGGYVGKEEARKLASGTGLGAP